MGSSPIRGSRKKAGVHLECTPAVSFGKAYRAVKAVKAGRAVRAGKAGRAVRAVRAVLAFEVEEFEEAHLGVVDGGNHFGYAVAGGNYLIVGKGAGGELRFELCLLGF